MIMNGEKNLTVLLKSMKPTLVDGEYVFSTVVNDEFQKIDMENIICFSESKNP